MIRNMKWVRVWSGKVQDINTMVFKLKPKRIKAN